MKLKKTKKMRKMRGSRLHGHAEKKHKGSGNRGGKGMAGTGKRADHRKTWVIRYKYPYFGKKGFTSKKTQKKKQNIINLNQIQNNYKPGELDLSKYKILASGEIKNKFIIKAESASKSAISKIEKAGGKILLPEKKKQEKVEKLTEKKTEQVESNEKRKEDKELTEEKTEVKDNKIDKKEVKEKAKE